MKLRRKLTKYLTRKERNQRLFGLSLTFVPLITAYVLNLGFSLSFLNCPSLRYIGIPCPAWGLTRSFMAIARGDWLQAIRYHLFGPVIFAIFLMISVHFFRELITNTKIANFYIKILQKSQFQILFFFLLLIYHGIRLQNLWQSGNIHPFLPDLIWPLP